MGMDCSSELSNAEHEQNATRRRNESHHTRFAQTVRTRACRRASAPTQSLRSKKIPDEKRARIDREACYSFSAPHLRSRACCFEPTLPARSFARNSLPLPSSSIFFPPILV